MHASGIEKLPRAMGALVTQAAQAEPHHDGDFAVVGPKNSHPVLCISGQLRSVAYFEIRPARDGNVPSPLRVTVASAGDSGAAVIGDLTQESLEVLTGRAQQLACQNAHCEGLGCAIKRLAESEVARRKRRGGKKR